MVQNAVIIEATDRVGSYSAEEDDQFLFDCFFQHPAFGIVRELTKSECILYGNTGSGKTAIIRYLNQVSENSLQVDLNEIALNYIANSNIVKILEDLGVSQNLLFKAFWQYIIVLSYIKLKYRTSTKQKSDIWANGLIETFRRDKSRKKALRLLDSWTIIGICFG